MPIYFADASEQDTRGDRGKTTRRKGTKTVRGPEGAYIAMVKEELAKRPKGFVLLVWTEPTGLTEWCRCESKRHGWYATREDAETAKAGHPYTPKVGDVWGTQCHPDYRKRVVKVDVVPE